MPSINELRQYADQGNLYYLEPRKVRLGSKHIYKEARDYVEELYDHGDYETFGPVKTKDIPAKNVTVYQYRNVYFVVENRYQWMFIYYHWK